MEKFSKDVTAKWLVRNKDKLDFSLSIQRNEVWDEDRKSLFIHSLMYGFPFPPVYAQDGGTDMFYMLDGKQRILTTIQYQEDQFSLSENTPDIGNIELGGLKFSDLPKELQEEVRDSIFTIKYFRNMTEDERDEMFLRLNNGMSLTKTELTRVMAGSKVMDFVKEISEKPFFAETIVLSKNQRNRFTDQELIMQIMSLIAENGATNFSSKALAEFMLKTKEEGFSEKNMEIIRNVADYLQEVFLETERFMKKVNIPMIFWVAKQALNDEVSPEKFGGFVQEFFSGKSGKAKEYEYNNASSSGSAKKENVSIRLNTITQYYLDNINKTPNYKRPEPKETTGRGRPRTTTETNSEPPVSNQNSNEEVQQGFEVFSGVRAGEGTIETGLPN